MVVETSAPKWTASEEILLIKDLNKYAVLASVIMTTESFSAISTIKD